MKSLACGIAVAVAMLSQAPPVAAGGDGPWVPATAAAREVARQLDTMQRAFATIPPVPGGRGLYSQADKIQTALFRLQQSFKNGASREDVTIAYFNLDSQVKQLLDDLQGIGKWDAAVGYVSRRLRAAENDLHFAILGGANGKAEHQPQVLYRQTLALMTRAQDLEGTIKYVYDEQDVLPGWVADMKSLRDAIASLQQLQQNKSPNADLKAQLLVVNRAWEKLVDRFVAIPQFTYYLMQSDATQFDAVLGRVDRLLGVDGRKARLPANQD